MATATMEPQSGITETLTGLHEADGVALAQYRDTLFQTVAGNGPSAEEVRRMLHDANRTREQFEADLKLASQRVDAATSLAEVGNMAEEINAAAQAEAEAKQEHEAAEQLYEAATHKLLAARGVHRDLVNDRNQTIRESNKVLLATASPGISERLHSLPAKRKSLTGILREVRRVANEVAAKAARWRKQLETWGTPECPCVYQGFGVKFPPWHLRAGQSDLEYALTDDDREHGEKRITAAEEEAAKQKDKVTDLQSEIEAIDREQAELEASRMDVHRLRLAE